MVVATGGGVGDGKFALVDCGVGHVLRVEDSAEKLVRQRIAGLGGEDGAEGRGCLVDLALLEGGVGLSCGGCRTGGVGRVMKQSSEEQKGAAEVRSWR